MAKFTEEHSYSLALEGIKSLGSCGASICSAFSSLGSEAISSIISPINNAISAYQTTRIQGLQNELKEMEMQHAERMQKNQNKHEEKMLIEQNRHEEFIIEQQRKILEKMIDTASAAYKKKVDFLNAQLNCLQQTYNEESKLLSEHIQFLEQQRIENQEDIKKYMLISKDLDKLETKKSELWNEYNVAQGNLTDAIKYLEINTKYENLLGTTQNKLLGM